MPKFRVVLRRIVELVEETSTVVDAKTASDAEDAALEWVSDAYDAGWEAAAKPERRCPYGEFIHRVTRLRK